MSKIVIDKKPQPSRTVLRRLVPIISCYLKHMETVIPLSSYGYSFSDTNKLGIILSCLILNPSNLKFVEVQKICVKPLNTICFYAKISMY